MVSYRILALAAAAAALLAAGRPAGAYVEAAFSLGKLIADSTNIMVLRVEKLDPGKNLIIYRKVRDIKGVHPGETIKHDIGTRGFQPREWQNVMAWAAVGKEAVFFHNGGAGEICIDGYWYQVYAGDWWAMSHAEPYLLRSYAGKPEKLATAVAAMLAGQEVVVPCMVDGDKNAIQLRKGRIQRMRAGMKLQDYNAQRDFVGWGVEEFRVINDMPGFTHYAPIVRVSPGAVGIAAMDLDGDGKADLCLYGAGGLALLHSTGGSFDEVELGFRAAARGAAWGDYNGDGKCDLLLATLEGVKLFCNRGKRFEDVSAALPAQGYNHLTAAAWIDYDGDGRCDILLADAFSGLRLLRNKTGEAALAESAITNWQYAGPFDNPNGTAFDASHGPEKAVDLAAGYPGKGGVEVKWQQGKFTDGQIDSLALFRPDLNENAFVYLYREITVAAAMDLQVSLGSGGSLAVWLNGQRVLAEKVSRRCAPDQYQLMLKLKGGRNALLLRVGNGSGTFAFYFALKAERPGTRGLLFEDVSDVVGLGQSGAAGKLKGDRLAVADVNGDKRPDILYSAGSGVLLLNTPNGFVQAGPQCGIRYEAGNVEPAFGDFDGDGKIDLFIPQAGKCLLFKGDGAGKFTDVTAAAGDLSLPVGQATSAAWWDMDRDGKCDLLVGCLRGPNRCYRNLGGGKFADAGNDLGLYRRIFNTCAVAVCDINGDGTPDVVFNNEGQESAVLLGDPIRFRAQAVSAARTEK